jgi:hypothetical protein
LSLQCCSELKEEIWIFEAEIPHRPKVTYKFCGLVSRGNRMISRDLV